MIASTPPAAPSRCPTIDFVELTLHLYAASPIASLIEEMEPGVKAVGYKNVTVNEPFFQGHFPEYPVMPGVLLIHCATTLK